MGISPTLGYRENRLRFPLEELRKFDHQWVAFSADGRRVVASGASIADLVKQASLTNMKLHDLVLERIELEGWEIQLGGAELL